MAFYSLFDKMVQNKDEFPRLYEQYRDGVIVFSPGSASKELIATVKKELNATVLMYVDSMDIAIQSDGICDNPGPRKCYNQPVSEPQCSTGRFRCCESYNCSVFAANRSKVKLCSVADSGFNVELQKAFKAAWLINLLPNSSMHISKPTPLCYYYFGPSSRATLSRPALRSAHSFKPPTRQNRATLSLC